MTTVALFHVEQMPLSELIDLSDKCCTLISFQLAPLVTMGKNACCNAAVIPMLSVTPSLGNAHAPQVGSAVTASSVSQSLHYQHLLLPAAADVIKILKNQLGSFLGN